MTILCANATGPFVCGGAPAIPTYLGPRCQWHRPACAIATCTRTDTKAYLPGWRCPDHTPARIAGRAEPPAGDPYPRPGSWAASQGASGLIDDLAIASGKRRASQDERRQARARLEGAA